MDKEEMFRIYRQRKNFRKVDGLRLEGANPLCGDSFALSIKVKKGVIKDVGIEGSGCMLSSVSASLLAEYLKGKKVEEAKKLKEDDMYRIVGIDMSHNPVRAKCLLLPLHILKTMGMNNNYEKN
ncbi:MAG: iron-sulfur cluster assembly scaffold protein [Candidatus Anstonellales archaeon]